MDIYGIIYINGYLIQIKNNLQQCVHIKRHILLLSLDHKTGHYTYTKNETTVSLSIKTQLLTLNG